MLEQNSSLKNALISINFTEKQANVYLALLKLGNATASEIARQAGINRTTAYDILDSLVNQKLISISGKKPKQEYIAESPQKITDLLKINLEQNKKNLQKAKKLLPQLKSIHNIGDRPKIMFYEGIKGLIQVYEDTLTAKQEIKAFATVDDMHSTLPNYFPKYYKRRAKAKIKIKAIIPKTELAKQRIKHNKEELRQSALIPADKFYFSPEINIYDNKIMIASWREKLGIIIESVEIADAMKKIFKLAWEQAKRLDK